MATRKKGLWELLIQRNFSSHTFHKVSAGGVLSLQDKLSVHDDVGQQATTLPRLFIIGIPIQLLPPPSHPSSSPGFHLFSSLATINSYNTMPWWSVRGHYHHHQPATHPLSLYIFVCLFIIIDNAEAPQQTQVQWVVGGTR